MIKAPPPHFLRENSFARKNRPPNPGHKHTRHYTPILSSAWSVHSKYASAASGNLSSALHQTRCALPCKPLPISAPSPDMPSAASLPNPPRETPNAHKLLHRQSPALRHWDPPAKHLQPQIGQAAAGYNADLTGNNHSPDPVKRRIYIRPAQRLCTAEIRL